MLKIKDLKVSYGKLRVLKGVNLEIRQGECVGVIGESGTGKTTLALSIMRLIGENGSANLGGEILYKGKNLLKIEEEVLR
jgi:ABC-type glutathione transport system ATPase component